MPYIKQGKGREKFKATFQCLKDVNIDDKGELEYCIFKVMQHFMKNREKRYTNYHDAVYGTMHCADEYRRRFLDKREDQAKEENGDVLAE